MKPMYELGLAAPPADEALEDKAVELASDAFDRCGWDRRGAMASPVTGGHGAVEHLVHFRRRDRRTRAQRDDSKASARHPTASPMSEASIPPKAMRRCGYTASPIV